MKVLKFVFNPFGENTYVVYDEATRRAALIDPGMYDAEEERALADAIERRGLTVERLLYTHIHIDHTFGDGFARRTYGVKTEAGEGDRELGLTRPAQARMFHLPDDLPDVVIDRPLREGDTITLGPDSELRVLEVPGHSPGSLAYYSKEAGVVFTGDALFAGSVGRTDVPGGSHPTLISAIKEKLLTLPPETVVLAGHGPETTIGRERKENRFLRD